MLVLGGGFGQDRNRICKTTAIPVERRFMKNDEFVGIRIPGDMRDALERERRRMSKMAGAEVKTSAVIRSILELHLRKRRAASERAA